ncbi:MAG: CbrC family protein [Turicibacter sp.]|nr:CbrC family protein [Turicibacter sp.]
MSQLPTFKYHPNPLKTGAFKQGEPFICECCEKETTIYYTGVLYTPEEISTLCPDCIHSGRASATFDGQFVADIEDGATISKEAQTELFKRTPSYASWQDEIWLTHCGDGCAFIDYVGWDDIKGKLDDFADLRADSSDYADDISHLEKYMHNGGDFQGYLFQCLHCHKYRLHADCS